MKLPPSDKIAQALSRQAYKYLKGKQTSEQQLKESRSGKALKKLRKAFTQVEVAHEYCNYDPNKAKNAIKKLNAFTDPCGTLNDKLRQNAHPQVIINKANITLNQFQKLKSKHIEMKGCDSLMLMKRMNESKTWFIKKALTNKNKNVSDKTFHMIRFYLRQLMYTHKTVNKHALIKEKKELKIHKKCWKKLEDVSEKMGEMHDDLIDGKRTSCTLTPTMLHVIQWYGNLSYEE